MFRAIRKKLGLPCKHEPEPGWCGGIPYGYLKYVGTDGLNTDHAAVKLNCRHCPDRFTVAFVHLKGGYFASFDKDKK